MSRKLDLEDYVPVNERLIEFWEKHPDGAIKTELLHADDTYVRVYAAVFSEKDAAKLLATGLAEEKREGFVNRDSAVENGETSAIGRALANAGFKIKRGIASREEMQKVQRLEQSRGKAVEDIPMEPASHGGALDVIKDSEAKILADQAKEWINGDADKRSRLKLKLVELGVENTDLRSLQGVVGQLSPDAAKQFVDWLAA